MDKLERYLSDLITKYLGELLTSRGLTNRGKTIIEKEDVQKVGSVLEKFLEDAGFAYRYRENMEGRVLITVHDVRGQNNYSKVNKNALLREMWISLIEAVKENGEMNENVIKNLDSGWFTYENYTYLASSGDDLANNTIVLVSKDIEIARLVNGINAFNGFYDRINKKLNCLVNDIDRTVVCKNCNDEIDIRAMETQNICIPCNWETEEEQRERLEQLEVLKKICIGISDNW